MEPIGEKPVLERTKQQYFESPSTQLAKQAVQDRWMLYEREVLLKDGELLRFEGLRMPSDTIKDIREILQDPQRTAGLRTPYNQVLHLWSKNGRKPTRLSYIVASRGELPLNCNLWRFRGHPSWEMTSPIADWMWKRDPNRELSPRMDKRTRASQKIRLRQ